MFVAPPPASDEPIQKRWRYSVPILLALLSVFLGAIYLGTVGLRRWNEVSEWTRWGDMPIFPASPQTLKKRLQVIKDHAGPNIGYAREYLDNFDRNIPLVAELSRLASPFGPMRQVRYHVWDDHDEVCFWLLKPGRGDQRRPIEGATFDIDGERFRPSLTREVIPPHYLVAPSVLRRMATAKSVKIIADDPVWNYTLSNGDRKAIVDLVDLIVRIRSVK